MSVLLFWGACHACYGQKTANDFYQKGLQQSDLNKVVEYMTKAISMQPKMAEAWRYRGIASYHLGKKDAASRDFTQALQLQAGDPESLLYRGRISEDNGKSKEALQDYTQAIKRAPKYGEAFYRRGLCNLKAKNNAVGCKDLRDAKKLGFAVPDAEFAACTATRKKD